MTIRSSGSMQRRVRPPTVLGPQLKRPHFVEVSMRDRATPASATHPVPQRPVTSGGWLRRTLQARVQRRILAGRRRVANRVEQLGPAWRIVDYHPEDPDFLAIGPGGVFQVTVADHGRTKVEIAGDVVQIAGQRPPYVALARRDA